MRGKRTFTCSNPSCKKTFNVPLKTLNLNQDSAEPFDACPYCLTRIEGNNEPEKTIAKSTLHKEKPAQKKEKPIDCHYHFGYLSEREQKEQIPDDCIVCKDILDCMLKKIR
ncbi:MAG: hypothetical protein ACXV2C_03300 [Candidatus Bathyarchaeia archaeon]